MHFLFEVWSRLRHVKNLRSKKQLVKELFKCDDTIKKTSKKCLENPPKYISLSKTANIPLLSDLE